MQIMHFLCTFFEKYTALQASTHACLNHVRCILCTFSAYIVFIFIFYFNDLEKNVHQVHTHAEKSVAVQVRGYVLFVNFMYFMHFGKPVRYYKFTF